MKKLSQWLDEFVQSGADPLEVEEWPQNTEKKDYKHLLRITFSDGCETEYIFKMILNTDYETAMTDEQFKGLFTKGFGDYEYIEIPTYQYENTEDYAPALLGYDSDNDYFYDYVSTMTLTLVDLHDVGRESTDQDND